MDIATQIAALLGRASFADIEADLEQGLRILGMGLELTITSLAEREGDRLVTRNQFRTNGYMDPAFELDLGAATWWRNHLEEGDDVIVDDIDELPESAAFEATYLRERSTASIAAMEAGPGTGFYIIAEVLWSPRSWSPVQLEELAGAVRHFGAALTQHQERAKLASQARAAAIAAEAKSQFIATLAHELRTPLTAIIGYAQLLTSEAVGPLKPKQRQFAEDIVACAEHLERIVNESLDLAKLDSGRMALDVRELDARELIEAAALQVRARAESKGLELILELPDDPVSMTADEVKLRQVLINLLTNAVKFTRAGSVTVTLETPADRVEIAVRDTGIGISPTNLERIFDSFARVHRSRDSDEGTGLGLALVKRLVELHRGEISVESELGVGSRFLVSLPRRTMGALAGRPAYVRRVL